MPRSFTAPFAAALAAGLAAAPLSASACLVPVAAVPQPAVACTAVKINSGGGGAPWWGTFNCQNGLAYNVRGAAPVTTVLALPGGMVKEQAYDVDRNGFVVGAAFNGAGVATPEIWQPNGVPIAPPPFPGNCPLTGIAAGIEEFGWPNGPVVGQTTLGGVAQACWWAPGGARLIGPPPAPSSFAYDVNNRPSYVGQLNSQAAAAVSPAALVPLPGLAKPSVAYAINNGGLIVGHESFGAPPCPGDGFETFGGAVTHVGPLAGDCNAGLEDLNETAAAVGYSLRAGLQQAIGFNLAPPYPGGLVNLNAGLGACPWKLLGDAPGIADNGFIIATDTGVAPTRVYVLQ